MTRIEQEVLLILTDVLRPDLPLDLDTALMGAHPQFDSMAAAAILASIEDHFGLILDDDDISAELFVNARAISLLMEEKLFGSAPG